MAENEAKNETALAALSAQQLTIRHALVQRGLQNISENENIDMYSWLANAPRGSSLLSLSFLDGSELPSDDRNVRLWSKLLREMSEEEKLRELLEERCSGLPTSYAFRQDVEENKYVYRGYIEIEGVHPFERSSNLVGVNKKETLLAAVGILVRRLLVGHGSMRIYCDGDTLLQFLSANLKDVQTFIEEINSELRTTVARIRKPDGTIAKRQSGLSFVLTEHHRL